MQDITTSNNPKTIDKTLKTHLRNCHLLEIKKTEKLPNTVDPKSVHD